LLSNLCLDSSSQSGRPFCEQPPRPHGGSVKHRIDQYLKDRLGVPRAPRALSVTTAARFTACAVLPPQAFAGSPHYRRRGSAPTLVADSIHPIAWVICFPVQSYRQKRRCIRIGFVTERRGLSAVQLPAQNPRHEKKPDRQPTRRIKRVTETVIYLTAPGSARSSNVKTCSGVPD